MKVTTTPAPTAVPFEVTCTVNGIAYALPGEAIIQGALWTDGNRWLPGQLLSAVAHGGTDATTYARALLLVVIYALLAGVGTLILFQRRDA